MFTVTKLHTSGILAGITTTETTSVPWEIGAVVDGAIGGGSYEIVGVGVHAPCDCVTCKLRGVTA